MNQSERVEDSYPCSQRQARENACEQVTISTGFTSDWSRKWRDIFLAESQSNGKPKQSPSYLRRSIENRSIFKCFRKTKFLTLVQIQEE